jgi:hypothetical protein
MIQTYTAHPIPSSLVNSFEMALPANCARISFRPPPIRSDFFPYLDPEAVMVADWCLPTTFKALSLRNILLIFSAILLEKQILIVCSNLGLLSSIVMGIVSLIRPFVWQGLWAPVLPSRMHSLLDAPVPYIFGVQSLPQHDRSNWEGMTVHVDTNNVSIPSGLQALPEGKKLQEKLNLRCNRAFAPSSSGHHPSSTTTEDMEIVNDALACLLQYTLWFSKSISSSVISSFRDVFGNDYTPTTFRDSPQVPESNLSAAEEMRASMDYHKAYKEKKKIAITNFLRKVSPFNRPFIQHFINTQMFSAYCETFEQK